MFDGFSQDSSTQPLCICRLDIAPRIDLNTVDLTFVARHSPFWLNPMPPVLVTKALDFLSHRISNNPNDLLAHLQRVTAHYHSGTPDTLYGALLDLFVVLDTKGYALRQRLLAKCAPLLGIEQQQTLDASLQSGLNKTDVTPLPSLSRLIPANVGTLHLLERQGGPRVVESFNALDEARDLIDSGFIDEARMLLETLLFRQPECEETSKELLDLYRYTKNSDAFFATHERFRGLPLALASDWNAQAERLLAAEEGMGNG